MSGAIISSEGLLRLAELVEWLRTRDLDEGGESWTSPTTGYPPPDPDKDCGEDAVERAAGAEPAGRASDPDHARGPGDDLGRGSAQQRPDAERG